MAMEPIKNLSASATGATSELPEIKKTETAEVKSTEAKALDEAKTNENSNVAVSITDAAPKEEKKGFFAKIWDAIKSPFVSDNTAGKAVGGGVGVLGGAGIGFLLGGPIGAIIGGAIGLATGFFSGNAIQEAVENKNASPEELAAKENANKTIETINEDGQKVVTQYDENGNKIKETFMYSDGEVSEIKTYEYDKDGKLVKETQDYGGDGEGINTITHEYDEKGNLALSKEDYGSDGENNETTTYQYDEKGNMIKKEFDDAEINYEYDENGNKTKQTMIRRGSVDEQTWQYDEKGNMIKYTYDDSDDNADPELIETYTRDESGKVTKKEIDNWNDGVDTVEDYVYDTKGRLARKTVETTGDYNPGKVEARYYYDNNSDTVNETYVAEYDPNGNVIKTFLDRDGDGIKNGTDEYHEYTYNDKNQMIAAKYDGSDGKWNTTYEYDENGNKIKELIDYDFDGVAEYKIDLKTE